MIARLPVFTLLVVGFFLGSIFLSFGADADQEEIELQLPLPVDLGVLSPEVLAILEHNLNSSCVWVTFPDWTARAFNTKERPFVLVASH